MQGIIRGVKQLVNDATLKNFQGRYIVEGRKICSRFGCVTSSSLPMQEKGLENITVADILMAKGDDKVGSWRWCRMDDAVNDAVRHVR